METPNKQTRTLHEYSDGHTSESLVVPRTFDNRSIERKMDTAEESEVLLRTFSTLPRDVLEEVDGEYWRSVDVAMSWTA